MKATTLLERQHRKIEALFKQLEGGRSNPTEVLEELATALVAHMVIEEKIFYPAARSVRSDLVLESYEEHEMAAYGLKRLIGADTERETFKAKVGVEKEVFERHVKMEEQELLPAVAEALGDEQNDELGRQMEARFKELVEGGYEAAVAARKARRSGDGARGKGSKKSMEQTAGR